MQPWMELQPGTEALPSCKGNQSWIFTGKIDAETEVLILWPPDKKNWLIRKDPDAGEVWRQRRGWQNEMIGWHHRLNGHEFEQAPGDSDGQGSLAAVHGVAKNLTRLSDWTELTELKL